MAQATRSRLPGWMSVIPAAAACVAIAVTASKPAPARAQPDAWQTLIALPETRASHGVANGVAIDTRGSPGGQKWAYTVDTSSGRLIKFGTGGRIITSWPVPNTQGRRARVAVDSRGNVYVASGSNNLYSYSLNRYRRSGAHHLRAGHVSARRLQQPLRYATGDHDRSPGPALRGGRSLAPRQDRPCSGCWSWAR